MKVAGPTADSSPDPKDRTNAALTGIASDNGHSSESDDTLPDDPRFAHCRSWPCVHVFPTAKRPFDFLSKLNGPTTVVLSPGAEYAGPLVLTSPHPVWIRIASGRPPPPPPGGAQMKDPAPAVPSSPSDPTRISAMAFAVNAIPSSPRANSPTVNLLKSTSTRHIALVVGDGAAVLIDGVGGGSKRGGHTAAAGETASTASQSADYGVGGDECGTVMEFVGHTWICHGATATFRRCRFVGGTPAVPRTILVRGPQNAPGAGESTVRAVLRLRRCSIVGGKYGVYADRNSRLLLSRCAITGTTAAGVFATGNAQINVSYTLLRAPGDAGAVLGGTTSGTLRHTRILGAMRHGVLYEGCSSVWLHTCSVRQCGVAGVSVTASARPTVLTCSIRQCTVAQLLCGDTSFTTVRGSTITGVAELASPQRHAAQPPLAAGSSIRNEVPPGAVAAMPTSAANPTVGIMATGTCDVRSHATQIVACHAGIFAGGTSTVLCDRTTMMPAASPAPLRCLPFVISQWASLSDQRSTFNGFNCPLRTAEIDAEDVVGSAVLRWSLLAPAPCTPPENVEGGGAKRPSSAAAAGSVWDATNVSLREEGSSLAGRLMTRTGAAETPNEAEATSFRAAPHPPPPPTKTPTRPHSRTNHNTASKRPVSALSLRPYDDDDDDEAAALAVAPVGLLKASKSATGGSFSAAPSPSETALRRRIAQLESTVAELRAGSCRQTPCRPATADPPSLARTRSTSCPPGELGPRWNVSTRVATAFERSRSAEPAGAAARGSVPYALPSEPSFQHTVTIGRFIYDVEGRKAFLAGQRPLAAVRYEKDPVATGQEPLTARLHDKWLQQRRSTSAAGVSAAGGRRSATPSAADAPPAHGPPPLNVEKQSELVHRVYDAAVRESRERQERNRDKYLLYGGETPPKKDVTAEATDRRESSDDPASSHRHDKRSPSTASSCRRATSVFTPDVRDDFFSRLKEQADARREHQAKLWSELVVTHDRRREGRRRSPSATRTYCESLHLSHRNEEAARRAAAAVSEPGVSIRETLLVRHTKKELVAKQKEDHERQERKRLVRPTAEIAAYSASLFASHKDELLKLRAFAAAKHDRPQSLARPPSARRLVVAGASTPQPTSSRGAAVTGGSTTAPLLRPPSEETSSFIVAASAGAPCAPQPHASDLLCV